MLNNGLGHGETYSKISHIFIFLCIPPMAWPTQQHYYYHWLVIPIAFPVLPVYNIPFFLHSLLLLDNPEDGGSKVPVKVYSTTQLGKKSS